MAEGKIQIKSGEDYLSYFDPDVYVGTYYSDFGENAVEDGFAPFIFKEYNEIFKSGAVHGNRLLDIGTGPIPHSVISATPFVKEIYLTDYVPVNRQYLHSWLEGTGTQTFSNVFQFFNKLENKEDSWSQRSDELKSKVAGIYAVDLSKDEIFGDNLFPKFDIITSSLCIEAVVSTAEDWQSVVRKVFKYLNPGGHFILSSVLKQTFYFVGEHKFFSCGEVSSEMFHKCAEKIGFSIESYKEMKGPPREQNPFSDFETLVVMHCRKK